jgi:hypothetical protein
LISAQAGASEDPDGTGISARVTSRVFQRLDGTFEEYPVLRINKFRFGWGVVEELGVE